MKKKPQFEEPSKAVILARNNIDYATEENIATKLLDPDLDPDEAFILQADLNQGFKSSKQFVKHAPELRMWPANLTKSRAIYLKKEFALRKRIRDRSVPLYFRERAIAEQFDSKNLPSGFLAFPIKGRTTIPRKFSLYHDVDGHRIYSDGGVEVTIYGDSLKVAEEGAASRIIVPSMHSEEDYEFRALHLPFVYNDERFVIGTMFSTTHQCKDKEFNSLRFKHADDKESSEAYVLCKHEIAGRLGEIEVAYNTYRRRVVIENNLFPLLSKEFARGAARALDSLLILDEKAKDEARRPRQGELEGVYWLMIHHLGAPKALYSDAKTDGKLKNYDWTMRK